MTTPDTDVFADNPAGNTPITAAKLNTLIGVANAALQDQLVPTGTKTGAYTAQYRDFVVVDATSGNVTITAPAAAAGRFFGVKKVDATANTVTVAAAASDTIGAQGATSITLRVQDETRIFDGQAGNWAVEAGMVGLPGLDARYGPILNVQLSAWVYAQAFRLVSATRDANEAITTASVAWPDGSTGTFTTDTASTSFPGAIDAYHVTYVPASGPTKTVTQTAVTRDAAGAVTAQPALVVA